MASYHSLPSEIKNLIHTSLKKSRLINKELLIIKDVEFINKMNHISVNERQHYYKNTHNLMAIHCDSIGSSLFQNYKYIISYEIHTNFATSGYRSSINRNHFIEYSKYTGYDLLSTYNILLCRKYNGVNIAKTTILNILSSKISLKFSPFMKHIYHAWLYTNAIILGLRELDLNVREIHITNYIKKCKELHDDIVNYFNNL